MNTTSLSKLITYTCNTRWHCPYEFSWEHLLVYCLCLINNLTSIQFAHFTGAV